MTRRFYLSPSGSDASDGRSAASAWRTLGRANSESFIAGDRLLLQGGRTFPGTLVLGPTDGGSAANPVVIGSYGTGRATIAATGEQAILIYNTAGIEVHDLIVKGDGLAYRTKGGIALYSDLPGDRKLEHIRIIRVDASNFRNGVEIGGGRGATGFRSVLISSSMLHHNMETGLATYGPSFNATRPTYAHQDVRIARVQAYANLGDPENLTRNTGSGIVLGSVSGGVVEWSSAYANGSNCRAPEGPAGIWTYDSRRVVIQHSLAHHNHTGGPADGDGFDLDQNVSASVLQYNLAYENDGAGYLVWTAQANDAHANNTVRYNVSHNDVRASNWYGAITAAGRVSGTQIYHNTVVLSGHASGRPPVIRLGAGLTDMALRNNILLSHSAGPLVVAEVPAAAVALQGNDYFAVGTPWQVVWGGRSYSSLSSWRTGVGQEHVGAANSGLSVDPGLRDPWSPLTVTDMTDRSGAIGLRLRADSPLVGRGLDLAALFDVAPSGQDFFGPVAPDGAATAGAHNL